MAKNLLKLSLIGMIIGLVLIITSLIDVIRETDYNNWILGAHPFFQISIGILFMLSGVSHFVNSTSKVCKG